MFQHYALSSYALNCALLTLMAPRLCSAFSDVDAEPIYLSIHLSLSLCILYIYIYMYT